MLICSIKIEMKVRVFVATFFIQTTTTILTTNLTTHIQLFDTITNHLLQITNNPQPLISNS